MKSLRSKASLFFKGGPSQDEQAAHGDSDGDGGDINFSADIQGASLRKKPSRFFSRSNGALNKGLFAPPVEVEKDVAVIRPQTPQVPLLLRPSVPWMAPPHKREVSSSDTLCTFPEVPNNFEVSTTITDATRTTHENPSKEKEKSLSLKKRPSLANIRSEASRIFRSSASTTASNNNSPPRPPLPQIPIDIPSPTYRKRRPTLGPVKPTQSARSLRDLSISRPILSPQTDIFPPLPPSLPGKLDLSFKKPVGATPPRPRRPSSIDRSTLSAMRDYGGRMMLARASGASGGSDSTATTGSMRSHSSSVSARLGLPEGYAGLGRDSRDSGLTGLDGVCPEDREMGEIEQYRRSREGDWRLEKCVRAGKGEGSGKGGMLFRDRMGVFHFVGDV